jgi:hypothetical protein
MNGTAGEQNPNAEISGAAYSLYLRFQGGLIDSLVGEEGLEPPTSRM